MKGSNLFYDKEKNSLDDLYHCSHPGLVFEFMFFYSGVEGGEDSSV